MSLRNVHRKLKTARRTSLKPPAQDSCSPCTHDMMVYANMAPKMVPCIRRSAALNEPPTAWLSRVPTMDTARAAHEPFPLTIQPTIAAIAHAVESFRAYSTWSELALKLQLNSAEISSRGSTRPPLGPLGFLIGEVSASAHVWQVSPGEDTQAGSWCALSLSARFWNEKIHRWFACSALRATVSRASLAAWLGA